MKKLMKKVNKFMASEKGDFSVKGIAITVAIIVIIGFAVTAMDTRVGTWIDTLWETFQDLIKSNIG